MIRQAFPLNILSTHQPGSLPVSLRVNQHWNPVASRLVSLFVDPRASHRLILVVDLHLSHQDVQHFVHQCNQLNCLLVNQLASRLATHRSALLSCRQCSLAGSLLSNQQVGLLDDLLVSPLHGRRDSPRSDLHVSPPISRRDFHRGSLHRRRPRNHRACLAGRRRRVLRSLRRRNRLGSL